MCESVDDLVAALGSAVAALKASTLDAGHAKHLVETFAQAERFAAAGRTLAAGRVAETGAWRSLGFRTAAQWVAAQTQASVGKAIASLETAHSLAELPATRDAFVAGRLSEAQATEISAAAIADPAAEQSLLAAAGRDSFAELREQCRIVRAAADGDEDVALRLHRSRYVKSWTERDSAVRFDIRLVPDNGARFLAVLRERADRYAAIGRRAGDREPHQAYMADALMSLVAGEAGPRSVVHVHVDADAFERGHTQAGEVCAIPGIGPITVAAARRLALEGSVKLIARDGVDVTRVCHMGKEIPAHVRSALEARDKACVVPGCSERRNLEIDHIRPREALGPTRLSNLARLCRYHHLLKTHYGWTLGGKPGAWSWTPGPVPEAVARRRHRYRQPDRGRGSAATASPPPPDT